MYTCKSCPHELTQYFLKKEIIYRTGTMFFSWEEMKCIQIYLCLYTSTILV